MTGFIVVSFFLPQSLLFNLSLLLCLKNYSFFFSGIWSKGWCSIYFLTWGLFVKQLILSTIYSVRQEEKYKIKTYYGVCCRLLRKNRDAKTRGKRNERQNIPIYLHTHTQIKFLRDEENTARNFMTIMYAMLEMATNTTYPLNK